MDFFTGFDLGPRDHHAQCRSIGDRQTGGVLVCEGIGHANQMGGGNAVVLGADAKTGFAGHAFAGHHGIDRHPVADRPILDICTQLDDFAGAVTCNNHRQGGLERRGLEQDHRFETVQAGGANLYDHVIGTAFGIGKIFPFDVLGAPVLVKYSGFHKVLPFNLVDMPVFVQPSGLRARRMIFPTGLRGSSSANSIIRGFL